MTQDELDRAFENNHDATIRDQIALAVAPVLLRKAFTAPYNTTNLMHGFDIEDEAGAVAAQCFIFADAWLHARIQKTHYTPTPTDG